MHLIVDSDIDMTYAYDINGYLDLQPVYAWDGQSPRHAHRLVMRSQAIDNAVEQRLLTLSDLYQVD